LKPDTIKEISNAKLTKELLSFDSPEKFAFTPYKVLYPLEGEVPPMGLSYNQPLYNIIKWFCELSDEDRNTVLGKCKPNVREKLNRIYQVYQSGEKFINVKLVRIVKSLSWNVQAFRDPILVEFFKNEKTRDLHSRQAIEKIKDANAPYDSFFDYCPPDWEEKYFPPKKPIKPKKG
jgi:hypothetical protein